MKTIIAPAEAPSIEIQPLGFYFEPMQFDSVLVRVDDALIHKIEQARAQFEHLPDNALYIALDADVIPFEYWDNARIDKKMRKRASIRASALFSMATPSR